MNAMDTDLVHDIRKYRETIQRLSDELRPRIQLAAMDAQTSWRELEPRLLEAEKAAVGIPTDATRSLQAETIKKLVVLRSRLNAAGPAHHEADRIDA
jgi:hypothetical protein